MRTFQFVFSGDVPSKKNSRILTSRNGRIMSFPGNNYRDWHDEMMMEVLTFDRPKQPINYPVFVSVSLYPKTKRRADLSNKLESIMDLLVDSGVLEDDNHFIVQELKVRLVEVQPACPRAEVMIQDLRC